MELKGHSDSVLEVKFFNKNNNSNNSSLDENLLISCGADKKIKLWDLRTNKSINSEKSKTGCKNLKISPNGSEFAFSSKDDDIINFFDMRKFQLIKSTEFKDKINDFEYEKTNQYFFVVSSKGNLMIYENTKTDYNPSTVIEVSQNNSLNSIKIEEYNSIFATGGEDGIILIWDMEELTSYKLIKKSDMPIRKLAFSHDSKLISATYEGPNIDIFDRENCENVFTVYTENQIYSHCWNPNGYILAFSGLDKSKTTNEEGGINIISV